MGTGTEHVSRVDLELWFRRGCALIVAAVAAYSSYEHQRYFALEGGADAVNAGLWPLSVDGLLLLATVGLFRSGRQSRRTRFVVWSAFLGCIAVSLAANIAAALTLTWQPVLAAGRPAAGGRAACPPLPVARRPRDRTGGRTGQRDRRRDRAGGHSRRTRADGG